MTQLSVGGLPGNAAGRYRRHRRILCSGLSLVVLAWVSLASGTQGAMASWHAPVDLASGDMSQEVGLQGTAVALSGSGEATVLYVQQGPSGPAKSFVLLSRSRPAGSSVFGAPQVITQVAADSSGYDRLGGPRLVSDGQGNLTAVWTQYDDQRPVLYTVESARRPVGGAWSAPLPVHSAGQGASPRRLTRLVSGPDGAVGLTWQDCTPAFASNQQSCALEVGALPHAATAWTVSQLDQQGCSFYTGSALALGAGDLAAVTYATPGCDRFGTVTTSALQAAFTSSTSTTFGAPHAFDDGTSYDTAQGITLDPSGHAAVLWSTFVYSCDSGGTCTGSTASLEAATGTVAGWDPATAMAGGDNVVSGELGSDSAGNLTAVWGTSDATTQTVQASVRPVGGNWAAPQQLAQGAGQAGSEGPDAQPHLQADPGGESVAMWTAFEPSADGVNAVSRVYVAHSAGSGNWDPPAIVDSHDKTYVDQPVFAFRAGVETVVAWNRLTYSEPNAYGVPTAASVQATWSSATTASDTTPPTITLTAPTDGAHYPQGAAAEAAYSCQDEPGGSGVQSCDGSVGTGQGIDTASPGVKAFTVTARDSAANVASTTVHYTVDQPGSGSPPVRYTPPRSYSALDVSGGTFPAPSTSMEMFFGGQDQGSFGLRDGQQFVQGDLIKATDNCGYHDALADVYCTTDITAPNGAEDATIYTQPELGTLPTDELGSYGVDLVSVLIPANGEARFHDDYGSYRVVHPTTPSRQAIQFAFNAASAALRGGLSSTKLPDGQELRYHGQPIARIFSDGTVIAAGSGNIIAAGSGNIIAAGSGNVIASGSHNMLVTNDAGNVVAIIAAGSGNVTVIASADPGIIAAGSGNVIAAGAYNFQGNSPHIIAAGAYNIIAAGSGNVIAAGSGNVIAAGAYNIIAAGSGNIIAAGSGNLGDLVLRSGATFSQLALGTIATSLEHALAGAGTLQLSVTLGGAAVQASAAARTSPLASGSARFTASRQTKPVLLRMGAQARRLIKKLAAANVARRRHHRPLRTLHLLETIRYTPKIGKPIVSRRRLTVTPGSRTTRTRKQTHRHR